MKKVILIVTGSIIALILMAFIAMYIYIDVSVKENIRIAKEKHPGKAEDALIAYVLDPTIPTRDRSSIGIWTLGQIHSQKAIPVLTELYESFPKGETCKGRHDSVLCQYEISKALKAAKSKSWLWHTRLNK